MSTLEILRIYADREGCSHFETDNVSLELHDYAPPAPPLYLSSKEISVANLFLELPAGWYGDWHPTPVRQWLVLISGTCELEVEDGEKRTQSAGDIVLLEDTAGRGHKTRVIGDEPARMTAIHLT
ncbi:MAG: cupin domain-containing protein [Desulfobulbia bacterium]